MTMDKMTNKPELPNENELLPCPFCGGEPRSFYSGEHGHTVQCQNFAACGAAIRDFAVDTFSFKAWNTRTQPQSQTAQGIEESPIDLSDEKSWDWSDEYQHWYLKTLRTDRETYNFKPWEAATRYAAQSQGPHYAANSYGIVSGRSAEEAAGKLLLATPPAAVPVNEANIDRLEKECIEHFQSVMKGFDNVYPDRASIRLTLEYIGKHAALKSKSRNDLVEKVRGLKKPVADAVYEPSEFDRLYGHNAAIDAAISEIEKGK